MRTYLWYIFLLCLASVFCFSCSTTGTGIVADKPTEINASETGTVISGPNARIASDQIWSAANSPYLVKSNLVINENVSLTIMPLTRIYVSEGVSIIVNGTLIARGQPNGIIKFTINPSARTGAFWNGIYFNDSSVDEDCVLTMCSISRAENGISCQKSGPLIEGCEINNIDNDGIYCSQNSNPFIKECRINNCAHAGIYSLDSAPTINGNTITSNGYGVSCNGNYQVIVEGNNIHDNDEYDLITLASTEVVIRATNNWWGSRDLDIIKENIRDKEDDPESSGEVLIMPIKTASISENQPPVADAGPDMTKLTGEIVILDGSASYDNDQSGEMVFNWTIVRQPQDSNIFLSSNMSAGAIRPSFIPKYGGTYVFDLVVTDGILESEPDSVTIEVIQKGARPSRLEAPTDITASTITLSWTKNNDDIFKAYSLYRSEKSPVDTSSRRVAYITDRDVISFTDTGLEPGRIYYYRVYVVDINGDSNGSEEIAVTTTGLKGPTPVSGLVSTDVTWTFEYNPYIVQGDLTVAQNATLTIAEGVTILFDGVYYLNVNGTLQVEGEKDREVIFTSKIDNPLSWDWHAIRFDSRAPGYIKYGIISDARIGIVCENSAPRLENCTIEHNDQGLLGLDSNPEIVDCEIRRNRYDGITIEESTNLTISSSTISQNNNGIKLINCKGIIENNEIKDNRISGIAVLDSTPEIRTNNITTNQNGIRILNNANPLITRNNISDNIAYNVSWGSMDNRYHGFNEVDADSNWWGTINEKTIHDKILDQNDTRRFGKINIGRFLNGPVTIKKY